MRFNNIAQVSFFFFFKYYSGWRYKQNGQSIAGVLYIVAITLLVQANSDKKSATGVGYDPKKYGRIAKHRISIFEKKKLYTLRLRASSGVNRVLE